MLNKIKVFHVENYKIMRDGIKFLLSQDPEIEIVGQTANGEQLMKELYAIRVDVLILDLYLDSHGDHKVQNGFDICASIRKNFPGIKIIAHSVYDNADRVAKILKAGALGFISKKTGFEELLLAIRTVARGEIYICSETSRRLKNLNQFLSGLENKLKDKEEVFSLREREVLELLGKGKSSREIAGHLFITQRTVESHRKNMIRKSNVKNTAELIVFASSIGILKN